MSLDILATMLLLFSGFFLSIVIAELATSERGPRGLPFHILGPVVVLVFVCYLIAKEIA